MDFESRKNTEAGVFAPKISYSNLTFWISLLCTLVFGSIIWFYLEYSEIEYDIDDLTSIYTGFLILFTIFYYSRSTCYDQELNNEEFRLKKLHYSYDVFDDFFLSPILIESQKVFGKINDDKIKDAKDYLLKNKDAGQQIRILLNYFEYISVLAENGLVEMTVAKDLFKTLFVESLNLLKPYIQYLQDNRSKRLYKSYCKIAENWSSE